MRIPLAPEADESDLHHGDAFIAVVRGTKRSGERDKRVNKAAVAVVWAAAPAVLGELVELQAVIDEVLRHADFMLVRKVHPKPEDSVVVPAGRGV